MSEGTEEAVATETPAVAEAPAAVETEKPETETAEAATEGESTEEAETTEETEEETKPKRESYNKRLKRKNQYLQSEILRLSELANKPAAEPDKAPREEDFNGDWGKYIAATAAFEAAKAVKGSLAEDKKTANQARVAELQSEVLADFNERTEDFKAKATDFDAVVSAYWDKGGRFSDAVRELVWKAMSGRNWPIISPNTRALRTRSILFPRFRPRRKSPGLRTRCQTLRPKPPKPCLP
jgi:hypothetical protein